MKDSEWDLYVDMLNRIRTGKLCQYCQGERKQGKIDHKENCPVVTGVCSRPDCKETEYRIDGYCSIYCRDTHFYEIAIDELQKAGEGLRIAMQLKRGEKDAIQKWREIASKYGVEYNDI